jgi:hypothetical protein
VEKLWMIGAFPVERVRTQIFFAPDGSSNGPIPACAPAFVRRFACVSRRDA